MRCAAESITVIGSAAFILGKSCAMIEKMASACADCVG